MNNRLESKNPPLKIKINPLPIVPLKKFHTLIIYLYAFASQDMSAGQIIKKNREAFPDPFRLSFGVTQTPQKEEKSQKSIHLY